MANSGTFNNCTWSSGNPYNTTYQIPYINIENVTQSIENNTTSITFSFRIYRNASGSVTYKNSAPYSSYIVRNKSKLTIQVGACTAKNYASVSKVKVSVNGSEKVNKGGAAHSQSFNEVDVKSDLKAIIDYTSLIILNTSSKRKNGYMEIPQGRPVLFFDQNANVGISGFTKKGYALNVKRDVCINDNLDVKDFVNFIYPIGSIYMSVSSAGSAILFGGS